MRLNGKHKEVIYTRCFWLPSKFKRGDTFYYDELEYKVCHKVSYAKRKDGESYYYCLLIREVK